MSKRITLYDIASSIPGQAWSPNTWKTRYCLNYKELPYQTVWVEYPDIEIISKKHGIPPTDSLGGKPRYTFPAIYDPNTDTALADSAPIAEYLDATYPNTPKLFPTGTHTLQHAFSEALLAKLSTIRLFTTPQTTKILNPVSADFFRHSRERMFGKKLEDITPTGSAGEVEWAKIRAGFDVVNKWLQMGKNDGPFILGKEPGFADFVVAGYLLWIKKVLGGDSSQWKDIIIWNDGRWLTFLQLFERYETIV